MAGAVVLLDKYLNGNELVWDADGNLDASTLDSGDFFVIGGIRLYYFSTAITENSTTTSAAAGTSFAFTTHATGRGKVFYSDGTNWQLAIQNVAAGALAASAAGRAMMADGFFDAATALAKFAADSITNTVLLDAVQDGAFVADAATRALFGNGFLTKAKAAVFVSTEQTATGASQNVAHGLGAVPAAVLVVPTSHPGTPDTGAFDIAEGAHDATNVIVTVTADVTFKVFAWA